MSNLREEIHNIIQSKSLTGMKFEEAKLIVEAQIANLFIERLEKLKMEEKEPVQPLTMRFIAQEQNSKILSLIAELKGEK